MSGSRRGDDPTGGLDRWVRQRSVYACVQDMAAGRTTPRPIGVELHLGTSCNLDCPECISRPTLETFRFSKTRALEIASEIVALGVKSVVLSGGGEPLLHPSAHHVMRTLHDGGVRVSLITNGTLLHHHEEAVVASADRIRVSVDAATAATHARFRPRRGGGDLFAQLVRNLESVAPRTRGRLTFSFLLMTREGEDGELESNVGEIHQAARLARRVGSTTFELNLAFDGRLQPNPLHERVAGALAGQLREAEALSRNDFRVYVDPLVAEVAAGRGAQLQVDRHYASCPSARLRALVTPRGVYLCPRHQGLEAARYGDPRTTPLAEIWASPELEAALGRVDPRVDCPGACMALGINESLLQAIEWARENPEPRLVDDDDLWM